jgi:hypothetical protein
MGTPQRYYEYKYDTNNKLVETKEFMASDSTHLGTYTYRYDTEQDFREYYYMGFGRLDHNIDSNLECTWQYKYDNKKNLVELNVYTGSKYIGHHVVATYNDNDEIIFEEGYDIETQNKTKAQYSYIYFARDKNGNWLKMVIMSFGKTKTVVKREIEYY